jgi:hypothetical protein
MLGMLGVGSTLPQNIDLRRSITGRCPTLLLPIVSQLRTGALASGYL